jgi:hypothetical protein
VAAAHSGRLSLQETIARKKLVEDMQIKSEYCRQFLLFLQQPSHKTIVSGAYVADIL